MAEGIILKSGSSGDFDQITASASDIRKGKVSVNADGDTITGTLTENSTINTSINAGGSVTIPAGIYNSAGKVTGNSLSSQTGGTASAAYISSGKTAWVNGSKITGSLATQGGSTTTPGTSNKTIVTAAKHVTGNIVVAGSGNLTAANIKKGVNIFGVTGTFEGYVAGTNDIFKNGTWGSGWSLSQFVIYGNNVSGSTVSVSGNNIVYHYSGVMYINKKLNFGEYKKFNIRVKSSVSTANTITLFAYSGVNSGTKLASVENQNVRNEFIDISLDLTSVDVNGYLFIRFQTNIDFYIDKIWLTK